MWACIDLGLWITYPDLGQPSQTSDRGKNVKAPSTEEDNVFRPPKHGSMVSSWVGSSIPRVRLGQRMLTTLHAAVV